MEPGYGSIRNAYSARARGLGLVADRGPVSEMAHVEEAQALEKPQGLRRVA